MSLTLVHFEAFMFHHANIYAVTNNGSDTCTLDGYPSVLVFDASPGRGATAHASHRDATPIAIKTSHADSAPWAESPTSVTIRPGASAGLIIGYVEDPNGTCQKTMPVSGPLFQVTLPGAISALSSDQTSFDVCPDGGAKQSLYISPILPQAQPVEPAGH